MSQPNPSRGPWWLWSNQPPQTQFSGKPPRRDWKRLVLIGAAAICGGFVGFVVGLVLGVIVPNNFVAPGFAPISLLLVGLVVFAKFAARSIK